MTLPEIRSNPYKPKNYGWLKWRVIVRSRLTQLPVAGRAILNVWRAIKLLTLKSRWEIAALAGHLTHTFDAYLDINKICWVSPNQIVYSSLQEFDEPNYKGKVIDGDWDRLEKKFEDLDVYHALKQVCLEGKPWADTIFYKRMLGEIQRGHYIWGCTNQKEFDQRCCGLEDLFHSIARDGYKSQRELMASDPTYHPVQAGEVTVSIGRHGDLLFSDGAHRLAIAKLLALPSIPIEIAVRHPGWMAFRKEIALYAQQSGGKTYQPVLHPDLSDIPAFHSCDDRFALIQANLTAKRGRLLDIGANWGYFCHRFEDLGFECYAVEDLPREYYFLDKLKRAANKKFKTIHESVLDSREIRHTHYAVVLALNIFHHFIKTGTAYEQLVDLLNNLQMDELFFEPHRPDEPQMKSAFRNYTPAEFVDFLLQHSHLKNAVCIGQAQDGRPIYKLFH